MTTRGDRISQELRLRSSRGRNYRSVFRSVGADQDRYTGLVEKDSVRGMRVRRGSRLSTRSGPLGLGPARVHRPPTRRDDGVAAVDPYRRRCVVAGAGPTGRGLKQCRS
jgi:hypothetical protein